MRKTQLEIIDSSLFLYGALATFFLVFSAFLSLNNPSSLILLLVFLPIAFYFGLKIFLSLKKILQTLLNLDHEKHPYFGNFSLTTFMSQTDPTFLFNLVLLCFAIALILFRISLQNIK